MLGWMENYGFAVIKVTQVARKSFATTGEFWMLRISFCVALLALACSTSAYAGDRRYSHKAGATEELIEADETECFEAGKLAMHKPSAPNPYNPATQSSAAGAAGTALAQGMGRGLEGARAYKLTYFNCLSMKGYTQRAMPSAEWKALKKLPDLERRARLVELMTAPTPQHSEMAPDEYD